MMYLAEPEPERSGETPKCVTIVTRGMVTDKSVRCSLSPSTVNVHIRINNSGIF